MPGSRGGIGEFAELARTVRTWESGLLANFDSGATNGATEGVTNLIKVVKREGFGYRNFENFRLRVLYRSAESNPSRSSERDTPGTNAHPVAERSSTGFLQPRFSPALRPEAVQRDTASL